MMSRRSSRARKAAEPSPQSAATQRRSTGLQVPTAVSLVARFAAQGAGNTPLLQAAIAPFQMLMGTSAGNGETVVDTTSTEATSSLLPSQTFACPRTSSRRLIARPQRLAGTIACCVAATRASYIWSRWDFAPNVSSAAISHAGDTLVAGEYRSAPSYVGAGKSSGTRHVADVCSPHRRHKRPRWWDAGAIAYWRDRPPVSSVWRVEKRLARGERRRRCQFLFVAMSQLSSRLASIRTSSYQHDPVVEQLGAEAVAAAVAIEAHVPLARAERGSAVLSSLPSFEAKSVITFTYSGGHQLQRCAQRVVARGSVMLATCAAKQSERSTPTSKLPRSSTASAVAELVSACRETNRPPPQSLRSPDAASALRDSPTTLRSMRFLCAQEVSVQSTAIHLNRRDQPCRPNVCSAKAAAKRADGYLVTLSHRRHQPRIVLPLVSEAGKCTSVRKKGISSKTN